MTRDTRTLREGVFQHPRKESDMFIGWAPAPAVDRRFLLGALPVLTASIAAGAYGAAANLSDPGAGAWLTGATHRVDGVLDVAPYPMIRTADPEAPHGMRTTLVVSEGKCTSALKLDAWRGRSVTGSGVLVQRKDRRMLETPLFADKWLEAGPTLDPAERIALEQPAKTSLGDTELSGTIMDTKCFFGVMRPARGATHKACASLCIRGGVPPSFWARDKRGREVVLLMTTADGGAMPLDILPFVADPVRLRGEIVRVGDLLQLRADPDAIARI